MGTGEEPLRRRFCRGAGCGVVFWICRHCDRGHQYCGERCRRKARRQQRRDANRRLTRNQLKKSESGASRQQFGATEPTIFRWFRCRGPMPPYIFCRTSFRNLTRPRRAGGRCSRAAGRSNTLRGMRCGLTTRAPTASTKSGLVCSRACSRGSRTWARGREPSSGAPPQTPRFIALRPG